MSSDDPWDNFLNANVGVGLIVLGLIFMIFFMSGGISRFPQAMWPFVLLGPVMVVAGIGFLYMVFSKRHRARL